MMTSLRSTLAAALALGWAADGGAARAQTPPDLPDRITAYEAVRPQADYVRREVMIPMRDGARLFTVLVMRKGVADGPILLTRTPYRTAEKTWRNPSQRIEDILPVMDVEFVNDGYIRVYQDVRGSGKSEGDYVVTRPLRGPLNRTGVDHSTDAWDTIDWLVRNVPETNGRVGITGSSYPGFTSLMALVDPHPALKAAVPQSPMVDGWMGDDWFHNGAFRQGYAFDYLVGQTVKNGPGVVPHGPEDQYAVYLRAGSAGDFARAYGLDALPFVRKLMEHPAYDSFWQEQAVDRQLARRPLTVPTMLVVGQWDQEDSYGAPAVYRALEPKDKDNSLVSLVIGPWRHSGVNFEGSGLAGLHFKGDTAGQFRREVMKPFLDKYLKTRPPEFEVPPVLTYATGVDRWEVSKVWPAGELRALYLREGGALDFSPPEKAGRDRYVSDPANPIPFVPPPVNLREGDVWRTWLAADQRFLSGRPDVLTYETPPLTEKVHIAGAPLANLFAATSGGDSDWVVELIDVYPSTEVVDPKLAGYQLPIGIEIFRGRYVHGFDRPQPLRPGKVENYRFSLPNVNHVFLPGHRIMVRVQSSLFPLYDRNPQTYVANIFNAAPQDYRSATQTVLHAPGQASAVWLPIAP